MAETNEKEIQSSLSMTVLQNKLKDLEEALNEANSESGEHTKRLTARLAERDAEIEQLKDGIKTKDAGSSDLEFQIKKYVSSLFIHAALI